MGGCKPESASTKKWFLVGGKRSCRSSEIKQAKSMPDSKGILHKSPKERVWYFGGLKSGTGAT